MASLKLASALKKAKSLGRNGDTILAHINPKEAAILKSLGGSGTINPHTKLPEFDNPSMGDYGGGGYGVGGERGPSANSGDGASGGGSWNSGGGGGGGSMASARAADRASVAGYSADPVSSNAYGGGGNPGVSNIGVASGGGANSSAASSFGSALSAGAGISPKGFETLSSGLSSIGDAFSGFMSSAPQTLSSLGNQANNTMLGITDTLNNGIASGYSFAKDYISNALSPQAPVNDVSYTQTAAAMGNPGFRSEAAMGNYDYTPEAPAASSAPSPDFLGNMMNQAAPFGGVEIMSPFTGTPMGVQPSSQQQFLDMLGIQGSPVRGSMPQEAVAPATYSYTPNPDVSYGLRYNPGTIQNAEYVKGAQIQNQFPNVNFGGMSNTDIGRMVTRTIAGEAANEGDLGQQLVGTNIMNRLALANEGIGLPGNFGPYASFRDIMKGYDANGLRRGTEANSVYNNPGANTEWSAFNAMSAALSPNAAINQARTNPMSAMELGAQYGVSPQDVANAVQSTHYYNPKYANPSWGSQMANAAQIGGHRFGSLDTSPNTWGVVNTAMVNGAAPTQNVQAPAPSAPQVSAAPQVASAPQADPNAQVLGGSGNYLGQVASSAPRNYEIDGTQLAADIKANNLGAGLFSDQSIIDKVIAGAPEGSVSYNPDTGKLSVSIGDVNEDGKVNQTDVASVLEGFKSQANVDPSGYTVAVAPRAPNVDYNVSMTPQIAAADVPSPNAQPVADVPTAPSVNRPVTPTPDWAYGSPIGVNPNAYAEPLNLPAKPNTVLGKAIDAGFGLTPLGLPNSIASLFGYSVGDMIANDVNVPRTPEEIQAIQERQFATSYGNEGGGGSQSRNFAMSQASKDAVRSAKTKAKANAAWKTDALAYGFTEEQLADREVADLIKQVYDLGFIPKSA